MPYTLKMKSLAFLADHRDFDIAREKAWLQAEGWEVEIIDFPPRLKDEVHRQVIQISRQIHHLTQIKEYLDATSIFMVNPQYIGVVFHNALWYQRKAHRKPGQENEWASGSANHRMRLASWGWTKICNPTAKAVEIAVEGDCGIIKGEFHYLMLILENVERRLKIIRETRNLIGAAVIHNTGATQRLWEKLMELIDETDR